MVVQVQEETGDAANCNMFTGTNKVDSRAPPLDRRTQLGRLKAHILGPIPFDWIA